jgi:lipoprotein-anchoring transpeptidase ErfK/SrfK
MRRISVAVVAAATTLLPLLASAGRADASVVVTINKSTQRMSVAVDGAVQYTWPVSTGRAPFGTPNGTFTPQMMARSWFSRKYYNSPMPHSIFYYKGYAIHGTTHISRLGGPASHGCVRLHPRNAATLFALVQSHGKSNTKIVVTGSGGVPRKAIKRSRSAAALPERPVAAASPGIERPSPFGVFDD